MGDAGEDEEEDDGASCSRRARLIAEWGNVRSARRLYTALNEHGLDMEPFALAVVRRLLEVDPTGRRADASGATRATCPYEMFMRAATALGEGEACDVVRAMMPKPPKSWVRLPGYLFNRAKSPIDRAPRTEPNARSHAPGRLDS
jgi:hypothetical protein